MVVDKDIQIGRLTFITAVRRGLTQLAYDHVAIFCADQAFIVVARRRHVAYLADGV